MYCCLQVSISPAGDILAYASTDLSIGFVDAQTLQVKGNDWFMQKINLKYSRY